VTGLSEERKETKMKISRSTAYAMLAAGNTMGNKVKLGCLSAIVLVASGCATANKSGFLSGYERLHRGRYLEPIRITLSSET